MKRAGAVAFAILMLASMVALPLGGALATAGASTGGPEGMLALGDAQIEEDVPADADLPISASDLEGAVYASDHADTLQLVLTTPELADDHLGENATVVANDDVAIVLSDDTVHEGREVAVDTDVLEAGVGFLPSVAYGTHESGEEWQSSIDVADGVASWSVPEFSSNSVTFTGGIELSGAEAGDGTTYEYDLDTLDGVGEYEIDVTGVETTEGAATSGTLGDGESLGVDIGGTTDPRDEELTLTGVETTESGSTSLGTVSSGTSETISVGGNQDPTDETVTLTGVETTASGSESLGTVSDGYSTTISVGGNQDPRDSQVTFTGQDRVESFSREHPSFGEDSFTVDTDAENVVVEYTNDNSYDMNLVVDTNNDGTYNIDRSVSGSGTIEIPDSHVTEGTNVWDLDGSLDYVAISGDLRFETEDPSVTVDGSTISHSGVLSDGETVTKSFDLSSGANTLDVSTAGDSEVSVDASWTEVTATEDPTVDIDGETVSHDGLLQPGESAEFDTDLSTGSNTASVSTGGGSEVSVDASWTEVTATEDPSVSVGNSTVSHSGVLGPGETVSETISLTTGPDSIDVSTSGEVSVDASWTEVSESVNPTISVNGYSTEFDGTLAAGETESLATNEAWLEEGVNTVTVSTDSPEVGPESLVGIQYAHDASGTTRSVDVEATSWTETFNVSHTYPSETADAEATLTFVDLVAEINDVEYRIDGGEWQSADSTSLDGTDLTVEFGDVAADTDIDVRATGHKIRTYDGEVDVLEPTVEGDELSTQIEITNITEDGMFGLRVDETVLGDRVHYASEQSWPGADAHAEITASGTQILRAPDANVGSTMTVESSPISVEPQTGSIEVVMEEGGEEPRFQVRQGDTVGTDAMEVAFYDTLSGERYVLWSETREVEVDADRATSPVTFTTDGDSETYSVLQRDASAGEDPPDMPTDTRSTLPLLLSFGGIGVVLVGTTLVGRRLDTGGRLLPITATSLTAIAIHVLAPTSPIERVAVLAYQSDVAAVAAVGLLLIGLWQLDERTEGEVPWYIRGVVGVLSVVWALETISPGVVLGGLREGVSTMGPLLVAALVLGGGYLARETLRARRADARTPDEQTTIEVRGFGEDGD